jgi:hypothetical protein
MEHETDVLCLSAVALQADHYSRLSQAALRLIDWAEEHEGTWADNSDSEVEFSEILEEFRELTWKERADAD